MHRGRLVIVGMLLIGIAAASLAVWVNYQQGRLALNHWGPDQALLIRDADHVTLIRLRPTGDELPLADSWRVADKTWVAERQVDVTGRIGTLRVREALLDDAAYRWSIRSSVCQPRVLHVLIFRTGGQSLEVILDTDCQMLRGDALSGRQDVSIAPTAAFFARWIEQQLP